MGFVAKPEAGKVYVDVGNAFCSGILDHHHPGAPNACTAMLVLNHPDFVREQVIDGKLTVIPHEFPDLDAITGAYFARMYFEDFEIKPCHHDWAEYVCRVDQGFTSLDSLQPVTPYSLFMMRMFQVRNAVSGDAHKVSLAMLEAGFNFLDIVFSWLKGGASLEQPKSLVSLDVFANEIKALQADLALYQQDIQQAEMMSCKLPKKDGQGLREAAGLWMEKPKSSLFMLGQEGVSVGLSF